MSQAKIIKIPGGDAFLEIGKDYIRMGTGDDVFIMLDKKSMSAGAKSVDWQLSPDSMTYYGVMSPMTPAAGMVPFVPPYMISPVPFVAIGNALITSAVISSAMGMVF
jgi:hypothetical protein